MNPKKHPSGAIARVRLLPAVFALLWLPTGCSTTTYIGDIQSPIALPAGTPERPATPYLYPAVHDMPPARPAPMLTNEQQEKMEADLVTARNRQTGAPAGQKPPRPKPKEKAAGGGGNP